MNRRVAPSSSKDVLTVVAAAKAGDSTRVGDERHRAVGIAI